VPNYKIMVFCTTARTAGFLAEFFRQAGLPGVLEIHSRMSQSARTRTSDAFRGSDGNVVMFTSDVSARGVDYPGCTLIVQVGLPSSRETYVHRLGRTARAGTSGKGVLLLCDYESEFLRKDLKGLPIELVDLGPMPAPGEVQWADAVSKARISVAKNSDVSLRAEQCYGAWLGYMNGHCKVLNWTKEQLVQEANQFAEQIGLPEAPALMKKTVGKMGLKGVPGLRLQ
jgi:ATP-dependent RNA helicase MSS116, mitochondrial